MYGISHRYPFNNARSLNGHVINFLSHDYMPPGTAGVFAGAVATVKVDAPSMPGKVVTMQFNRSVTVAHGTTPGTIRLKGSANVTSAVSCVMMYSYTSEGLWREVSRNF